MLLTPNFPWRDVACLCWKCC